MESHVCKNCHFTYSQKYCGNCGQKRFTERDKRLSTVFKDAMHFLTHFEGKFFLTLRMQLFRPGKLSWDYCYGIRQRYYKPVSFFLMLILLYLLFPMFEGLNMRLTNYSGVPITGEFMQQQITEKMASRDYSIDQISEIFKLKSEKISKVLLLLLIPLTAAALKLLYLNSRRKAFDHLILATEINSFIILTIFLLLPLLLQIPLNLSSNFEIQDESLAPYFFILLSFYFSVLLHRFYGRSWWSTIVKSILLVIMYQLIFNTLYKTALFLIIFAII